MYLTARPIFDWFVKAKSLLVIVSVLASNVVIQSAYIKIRIFFNFYDHDFTGFNEN